MLIDILTLDTGVKCPVAAVVVVVDTLAAAVVDAFAAVFEIMVVVVDSLS